LASVNTQPANPSATNPPAPTNAPPAEGNQPQPSAPQVAAQPQPNQDAIQAAGQPQPAPQSQQPAASNITPVGLPGLEFGAVQHLYYTDRALPLEMTRQAGMGWVRQQIHWRDIEDQSGQFFWGELDNIVNDVHAYGLKLMINVTRSPGWYTSNGGDGLPQDPQALARFVGALAQQYKGRVHAIMIWNEQNLAYENGGSVSEADAGHFVEIMAASYGAIKAVDPSIIVVAGAPASTATNIPSIALSADRYYRAMYSYNGGMMRDAFDVQAIHPGGSANPPETLWPDNPSSAAGWNDDATFYFRNVENSRKIMEEYGLGDRQVWITEFGWATANTTPGYEFGNQTSFEQQRDYIVGAMRYTADNYPWVSNMFLWNMNFAILRAQSGDPSHEQASFGVLNADGSPRPAWYGIQEFIASR
jgi:polysaccharide biosynthesis protein PslG